MRRNLPVPLGRVGQFLEQEKKTIISWLNDRIPVYCSCFNEGRSINNLPLLLTRQVHMYWSSIPPWTADGLLSHSNVYTQSLDCHTLLGVLLDQYGCCSSQSGLRYNNCAYYDNTEFRITGITPKGRKPVELPLLWLSSVMANYICFTLIGNSSHSLQTCFPYNILMPEFFKREKITEKALKLMNYMNCMSYQPPGGT